MKLWSRQGLGKWLGWINLPVSASSEARLFGCDWLIFRLRSCSNAHTWLKFKPQQNSFPCKCKISPHPTPLVFFPRDHCLSNCLSPPLSTIFSLGQDETFEQGKAFLGYSSRSVYLSLTQRGGQNQPGSFQQVPVYNTTGSLLKGEQVGLSPASANGRKELSLDGNVLGNLTTSFTISWNSTLGEREA